MAQIPNLLNAASDGNLSVFQELTGDEDIDYYKDKDGNTCLSMAARNGHKNLVKLLLAKDADIGLLNSDHKTPLIYAAENGHKEIVELLLGGGEDFNNQFFREAICTAASKGHEDIVKLVLEGFNLTREQRKSFASYAALSAAKGGHSSLLRCLIQNYGIDLPEDQVQKIFLRSAEAGHKEVVKLLLGRYDVDTNGRDPDSDKSALCLAVQAGHKDVVKLLLGRYDVDINGRDPDNDKSALCLAVQAGHKDVVALLLRKEDVWLDAAFTGGSTLGTALALGREDLAEILYATARTNREMLHTLLHGATKKDDMKTVKWLLTKDDIDVNAKDYSNRTPLHLAAENGCTDLVNLLLARSDIIINATDETVHETPLHIAVTRGRTEIVQLLLAKKDIIINARDILGETPLHNAARTGYIETAKLLLASKEVNVKAQNAENKTPLHIAAMRGRAELVQLLLAKKDIIINARDAVEDTPLHNATRSGDTETAKLLIASKEVNVNAQNAENKTPLHIAAESGYTEIVQLLLARNESNINVNVDGSRTLLHIGAENGHIEMVKFLLETDGINVNAKTRDYKTALFLALQNEHQFMIELLLIRHDLDLKAAEACAGDLINWAAENERHDLMDLVLARECNAHPNRTPLTRSSEKGYLKAMESLLKRDDIDVNSKDRDGRTPLSRAAEKGHSRVVEMLLQNGANRNFNDSNGRTPLSRAVENEHDEVVRQLTPHDTHTLLDLTKDGDQTAIVFMLRFKFNLEQKNNRGQTALHLTAILGHQDIAKALMLKGADVNSKDDYNMTTLQLAMQRKNEGIIQGLLEFKANTEGIMSKEWRDAFGKRNEDVVQLSRGSDDKQCVNFPKTIPLGEELLQTAAGIKSCLYLLSEDLNSPLWPTVSSDVLAQSRSEANKLQITTHMANGNTLDISISLRISTNIYLDDQALSPIGEYKVSRIVWRSMRPTNPSNPWNTVVYVSTLPYGWIPEDGVDMFRQFFVHIKSQWLEICHKLGNHLTERRLRQMESKGTKPEMIDSLAGDAQNLANLRTILVDQTSAAEAFISHYCSNYNANHIPKSLLELLKNDIELDITERIADLDQTVRDLLNIEFAWITINETRISTKLGKNVMLLTYVSIFYLPLGFCAALWAIPNITDTSTRTPFILTAITVSLFTLVITFNMESIAGFIQHGYNSYTALRREKKRHQNPGLP